MLRALPGFRGDCSERAFALRVAHNICLTHAWQRKRNETDPDPPDVPDTRVDLEAKVEQARSHERLMTAIRALPVSLRQVLTLSLEELSHAEIADVLGISVNNVAVRLSRAKDALRKELGATS